MSLKSVKTVKNIQWPVVGSVFAGVMLVGFTVYAVNRLPSNSATDVVKKVVNTGATGS